MWGGVKIAVAPEALPLTVAQLRARLALPEVGDAAQDVVDAELLTAFQSQAVALIDGPEGLGWAMTRQTWRRTASGFEDLRGAFLLPGAPFVSVERVQYMGGDGVWADLDPADYRVIDGLDVARIVPRGSWPSHAIGEGVVVVDYLVGPEAGEVADAALIAAVGLMVGHYWENREGVTAGVSVAEVPLGVAHIMGRRNLAGAG